MREELKTLTSTTPASNEPFFTKRECYDEIVLNAVAWQRSKWWHFFKKSEAKRLIKFYAAHINL